MDSARATLSYERLGIFSVFDVGATYERSESRSGEDEESSDYILGPSLGLELPLFDQNRAQIAKVRLLYRQAMKLRDALVIEATQATRAALKRVSSEHEPNVANLGVVAALLEAVSHRLQANRVAPRTLFNAITKCVGRYHLLRGCDPLARRGGCVSHGCFSSSWWFFTRARPTSGFARRKHSIRVPVPE